MNNPSHQTTEQVDFDTLALELQEVTTLHEKWWRLAQGSGNALLFGLVVVILSLIGSIILFFTSEKTTNDLMTFVLVNSVAWCVAQLSAMYSNRLKKQARVLEGEVQKKLDSLEEKTKALLETYERKTTSL